MENLRPPIPERFPEGYTIQDMFDDIELEMKKKDRAKALIMRGLKKLTGRDQRELLHLKARIKIAIDR